MSNCTLFAQLFQSSFNTINYNLLQTMQKELTIMFEGDYGVGKTTLIHRLVHYESDNENKPKLPCLHYQKQHITLQGKPTKLQLWDSEHLDKYRNINNFFFRTADIFILMFDVSNKQTYDGMKVYMEIIKNKAPYLNVLIIANKTDLGHHQGIISQAKQYAQSVNAPLKLTSMKDGDDMNNLLDWVLTNYKPVNKPEPQIVLQNHKTAKMRSRC